MATYVNDLRLKEIATGDESGTWGTSTNTNLELIAEAFSFGTEAITTNADTHTTTIADGATDPGRSIYLQYTGTLDSTCTITIGPNTVSKLWFIENATSGSQDIIIKQGSGSTVTVPNGQVKAIYSDGAGSGGKMVDAFQDLSIPDLFIDDDLTFTSDSAVITFGADGDTTITHTDGSGLTLNSTNKIMFNDASQFIQGSSATVLSLGATDEIDLTATAIDVNGTMDVSGAITSSAGATITVADNAAALTVRSTDADASVGPLIVFDRASGSPADDDVLGRINFNGKNDAAEEITYAQIDSIILDASDGTEDGQFRIRTISNGSSASRISINNSESVFNEGSEDLDFRVESNGQANMLLVDGGDDVVKMGGITGSASGTLKVKSNSSHFAIAIEENSGNEAYQLGVVADGSLVFTNSGSTEVMRLSDNNRVGVGTSSPSRTFHSLGGSGISTVGKFEAGGTQVYIQLSHNGASDADSGYIGYDSSSNLTFFTDNTEAFRITSGQDMYFGQTSGSAADVGHIMQKNGVMFHTADGQTGMYLRRLNSDGVILEFRRGSTAVGSINGQQSSLSIGGNGTGAIYFNGGTDVRPWNKTANTNADNTLFLGSSNSRWEEFFCANSTINTSDRNEKQDIEELSDAEKRVAVAAKGLLRKYRWKSAVAEKGDNARIHFGIIAQDLQDAFTAEGLDARRYAMFCSDTWTNDDGSEQTRLGVRYSELLAFIISVL
tara:strand:- start:1555 stop:3729 length:2175 start_codon:yes stop_codon:yes gene_type:complete